VPPSSGLSTFRFELTDPQEEGITFLRNVGKCNPKGIGWRRGTLKSDHRFLRGLSSLRARSTASRSVWKVCGSPVCDSITVLKRVQRSKRVLMNHSSLNLTFAFQNMPAELVTPCSTNNMHRTVNCSKPSRQTGGTVLINNTQ